MRRRGKFATCVTRRSNVNEIDHATVKRKRSPATRNGSAKSTERAVCAVQQTQKPQRGNESEIMS